MLLLKVSPCQKASFVLLLHWCLIEGQALGIWELSLYITLKNSCIKLDVQGKRSKNLSPEQTWEPCFLDPLCFTERSSWSKSEETTDMMPVWTDGAKILKALVISMLLLEHREGRVLFLHNSGIQSLWALITNTVSLFDIVIPLFDWCIEL